MRVKSVNSKHPPVQLTGYIATIRNLVRTERGCMWCIFANAKSLLFVPGQTLLRHMRMFVRFRGESPEMVVSHAAVPLLAPHSNGEETYFF